MFKTNFSLTTKFGA